jgi:glycosyltransferase involved in cell wall biosynthesis
VDYSDETMVVSIIIPAYNAEKYLGETIESVQAQSYRDWELIVVNDGSRDRTAEIAERYAQQDRRVDVLNKANGGVAAARNVGFEQIRGDAEFICFLDADDIWLPDTLQTLLQTLQAEPQAVAAHGLPSCIDAESRPLRPGELETLMRDRWAVEGGRLVPWPPERPTTFACEVVTNYVHTSGLILLRREILEKAGLFDERMGGCADWDLWLRLCRFGDLAFVDRTVLEYRQHADNMSGKNSLMAEDERYLRRKLLSWPEETPERRRLAQWGYRYRSLQTAGYRLDWAKGCLRAGKLLQAAGQMRHALRSYVHYATGLQI